MSRLLALIGAIAMIVVAIVVRGAIDDDDGSARASADPSTDTVVCATELRAACPSGGTVEDAAATADRLTAADAEVPGAWLTFDPWPSMVDDARSRTGLDPLFEDATPLASSPLAVVGPDDLGECDWACIVDSDLRIGTRPLDSGLGLLHLAALVGGVIGAPSYATNDIDAVTRSRIAAIVDGAASSTAPVRQLLQSRAFYDLALTTGAEATEALDAADPSRSAGLALIYPSPVANAVVVAAGDADLLGDAGGALRSAGWQASAPSGLPSAGVLTALRGLV